MLISLRAVPTILTAARMLLGPAFLLCSDRVQSLWPQTLLLAGIVLVAMATDWLDGMLARRWQAVTIVGRLLDPFADALFCMIVFADFAVRGMMWPWAVAVLIGREALVTFVLRPAALYKNLVVAAGPMGKLKTGVQFAAIFIVLASQLPLWKGGPLMAGLLPVSFVAVMCLSVGSALQYAAGLLRALSGGARPAHMAVYAASDGSAGGARRPGCGER